MQACWLLLFFFLHFIGIFSLLPSFPPEVAAFSPRGSLWTGPDVPGSTLPHSLPHGIFMGNQAPQHSTAQHRAAQTRDHLFIYFITLLPGCLMHNNSSTYKSIFSPSCFSQSHSPHPLSFIVFLFIGAAPLDTQTCQTPYLWVFWWIIPCLAPPSFLSFSLLLISLSFSFTVFLSLPLFY